MRKVTLILLLALLLLAMTAVPAFATIDGPPPGSAGCFTSSEARAGGLGGIEVCFEEPETARLLAFCPDSCVH